MRACLTASACDGVGNSIATGTCGGKESCCVQEKCFSSNELVILTFDFFQKFRRY